MFGGGGGGAIKPFLQHKMHIYLIILTNTLVVINFNLVINTYKQYPPQDGDKSKFLVTFLQITLHKIFFWKILKKLKIFFDGKVDTLRYLKIP